MSEQIPASGMKATRTISVVKELQPHYEEAVALATVIKLSTDIRAGHMRQRVELGYLVVDLEDRVARVVASHTHEDDDRRFSESGVRIKQILQDAYNPRYEGAIAR